jgi:hypothetical protein
MHNTLAHRGTHALRGPNVETERAHARDRATGRHTSNTQHSENKNENTNKDKDTDTDKNKNGNTNKNKDKDKDKDKNNSKADGAPGMTHLNSCYYTHLKC